MPTLPWPTGNGDRGSHGPQVPPVPVARAVVDCGIYVDGVRESGHSDFRKAIAEVRSTGNGFVWLGLHAPDERQMNEIAQVFDLHPLVVEDAVNAHQRPKLEFYDNILFLVLRSMVYVDHEDIEKANDIVQSGEIMVLAGLDFVITVRHGDHTQLAGVRQSLEADPKLLSYGPAAVVHAIADHVVDRYLEVVSDMESDVDEIEERVFTTSSRDLDIDVVYLFKREILELRRAVAPLGIPLAWLARSSAVTLPHPLQEDTRLAAYSEKEIRRHFRDVADHLTAAVDLIAEYDERLTTLLNAAATKVSIQQNTDMRKISSWAAIAAIPTMVAGIYGMNFDSMPELHWSWGYHALLLFLLGACITLWTVLRRHHWL